MSWREQPAEFWGYKNLDVHTCAAADLCVVMGGRPDGVVRVTNDALTRTRTSTGAMSTLNDSFNS